MQMTGQSPYISTYVAMSYFIGICKSQRERDFIVRENNRRQLRIEKGEDNQRERGKTGEAKW